MDKERSGERMKLGAFFHPTGNHVAAWLHPDAQIDAGTNFRHYAEITQTAERGKFDLMFVADAVATRDGKLEALSRWPQYMAYFDPLTLLPALAAVTTHVGLCATATTSYNEPYHIARKFASLDHIQLRDLLASGEFLYMPSATTPIDSSGVGDQQYIDRTRDLAGDPHLLTAAPSASLLLHTPAHSRPAAAHGRARGRHLSRRS